MLPVPVEYFTSFLLVAKRNTYAARGGVPVPSLVPGSKQLEYGDGALLYRDIYFGDDYFAGEETVYFQGRPIWCMCYAGGALK